MSSRGFSFPPPPPPPPAPSSQQQHHHHPTYPSATQYGHHHGHGQRGGRQRGRGRGFGGRGSRGGGGGGGGGHYGAPDAGHHSAAYPANAPPPSMGYPPVNYTGFPAQPMSSPAANIPSTSQYPSSRSPDFRHQAANPPPYAPPQPYSQPAAAPMPPYPHRSNYESGYNTPSHLQRPTAYHAQTTSAYPPVVPPPQHQPQPSAPPMMGPPMRWGFENPASAGHFPSNQRGHGRGSRSFNSYGNHHGPTGDKPVKHTNKRDYASAFAKPHSISPRTPAPPPVPTFGNPLPLKPPPPADASRKPKKKKRRYNQLGLTPKTEEHESSEEEDDADEEARLALGVSAATAPLQFTYRGCTSTLQSPSDIAAWIEERKKRYPTQARVEEKKKAMEEAKRAREEALKQKEARKQETKRQQKETQVQKEREKQERKEQQKEPADPVDAAEKAKRKAEKLRRKLVREEKRVAKAEADAERARLKVEELRKGPTDTSEGTNQTAQEVAQRDPQALNATVGRTEPELVLDEFAQSSHRVVSSHTPEKHVGQDDMTHVDDTVVSSSDASDSSDWTSSSGSDSSSSESEESDDDSAPEEVTSRREGPERVPPPPREGKKRLCRHFARNGRCLRGDKCKFSHEMPECRVKAQPPPEKKERKGLLQALLDRQKEDEDRRVMQAITWLGENGLLDEPTVKQEEEHSNEEGSVAVPNGAQEVSVTQEPAIWGPTGA